ncbi:protein trichome birefringence-like 42 [Manihot esculenta]|uniref:Uncharacterized protein n=1 Tax=Manihot esculenta TaxID=3983 RepID=A0A2C9W5Z2_MANES|nr:protein trichome birefringence-like 42 [Manihot esculenta]OAY54664.1 hypothetical protein MANES_03G092600v8 [Manihot esculenta]
MGMASWVRVLMCNIIIIIILCHCQLLAAAAEAITIGSSNSTSCDYFQGSWVYDDSYPLYNSTTCPFIGQGFDCQKNDRPDQDYLKYRWQPTSCDIPRFNGVDLLEKYRGKKIMFVGDSLSNNMWVSLACLLYASVPNSKYTFQREGLLSTFTLPEYGVSVMWFKNGFLVDVVRDEKLGRIVKLDSISAGQQWLGVDSLIFNTYHWWFHKGRYQNWNYFQVGDKLLEDMDRLEALKIALTTWARWVDNNIDPSATSVFYQGVAVPHQNAKEWNDPNPKARGCMRQTEPVKGSTYPGPNHQGEAAVKEIISNMTSPAYLLDITLLTQLRKDGHPSIYAGSGTKFSDCSHWCLAGVPDTWNQLLYAALLDK